MCKLGSEDCLDCDIACVTRLTAEVEPPSFGESDYEGDVLPPGDKAIVDVLVYGVDAYARRTRRNSRQKISEV